MNNYIYAPNEFRKKYSMNKYSQNGEDGIINELCARMGLVPKWVCEFGAWDGKFLSNTFQFIEQGTNAVLIEGDPVKYTALQKTAKEYPNIIPLCAMISHKNTSQMLDTLLSKTQIPTDFDILSIDIDGEDYHIWESLQLYNPKIVIIEINSLIHPDNTEYIHSSSCLGSGFGATLALGTRKGYTFVCHTGNMIFIRSDLFDKLNISYTNPIENFDASWYNNER